MILGLRIAGHPVDFFVCMAPLSRAGIDQNLHFLLLQFLPSRHRFLSFSDMTEYQRFGGARRGDLPPGSSLNLM